MAGGEDGGQVRHPERPRLSSAAAAAGPPIAGEDPGGAFPRQGSARGRGGPGSRPRPPPSQRWSGLSPDRGARRGRREGRVLEPAVVEVVQSAAYFVTTARRLARASVSIRRAQRSMLSGSGEGIVPAVVNHGTSSSSLLKIGCPPDVAAVRTEDWRFARPVNHVRLGTEVSPRGRPVPDRPGGHGLLLLTRAAEQAHELAVRRALGRRAAASFVPSPTELAVLVGAGGLAALVVLRWVGPVRPLAVPGGRSTPRGRQLAFH